MNETLKGIKLALKIWAFSAGVFGLLWLLTFLFIENGAMFWTAFPATFGAAIGSLPILMVLAFSFWLLQRTTLTPTGKLKWILGICFGSCLLYGIGAALITPMFWWAGTAQEHFVVTALVVTAILYMCALLSIFFTWHPLNLFFSKPRNQSIHYTQNKKMETTKTAAESGPFEIFSRPGTKITLKALLTGTLILLMMIPTIFIANLVKEREERQHQVAQEVSSKWANAQTLAGPYLYLPYKYITQAENGKVNTVEKPLWFLPDDLKVEGTLEPEIRTRSIYKVLLYHAGIQNKGNFIIQLPKEIDPALISWNEARICFSLSDFKGIQERLSIHFNGSDYELTPGLPGPENEFKGLSASVPVRPEDLGKNISFNMAVKIKGSGYLHFLPLSGNSEFSLRSKWPSPSFDGSNLPGERKLDENGFQAKWAFNKANLPFGTALRELAFERNSLDFGVTMVEPADQYAKTNRSVKYAILIIGLSFSVFFIVELMQKKPVHPVQYILVGIALVIFYTLLLSISEFLLFNIAYGIAALATISLISLYAKAHFANWKTAGIFAGFLSLLYGFIFILISLEDTALLVGSIGLFIVLALAMYASRHVKWYGSGGVATA